jgi:hypothetical protein
MSHNGLRFFFKLNGHGPLCGYWYEYEYKVPKLENKILLQFYWSECRWLDAKLDVVTTDLECFCGLMPSLMPRPRCIHPMPLHFKATVSGDDWTYDFTIDDSRFEFSLNIESVKSMFEYEM